MRKILVRLLVFLLPLTAQPAVAEKAVFDITANGLNYGIMRLDYAGTGSSYKLDVEAEAKGIFGLLLRAHYIGWAKGQFDAQGGLISDQFYARSKRIFKDRVSEVTFIDSRPKTVSITPDKELTELSDPSLVTSDQTDPLSLLAEMFHNSTGTCPTARDLYDGRRLTRISVAPMRETNDTLTCAGYYRIVSGPDHSVQPGKRKFGLELTYGKSPTGLMLRQAVFTSGGNAIIMDRRAGQ